jgi:hypothetical protein
MVPRSLHSAIWWGFHRKTAAQPTPIAVEEETWLQMEDFGLRI